MSFDEIELFPLESSQLLLILSVTDTSETLSWPPSPGLRYSLTSPSAFSSSLQVCGKDPPARLSNLESLEYYSPESSGVHSLGSPHTPLPSARAHGALTPLPWVTGRWSWPAWPEVRIDFPLKLLWVVYMYHARMLSQVRPFATPWTVALQAPLSMGFPRQEYLNGLPFPTPGDLPNPEIKPMSPASCISKWIL